MKAVIALVFLAAVATSYAGLLAASPLTAALPYPYAAYTTGYATTLAGNYQLGFDTSLPGSAYASYPYAAAPTAYGYGVIKAL